MIAYAATGSNDAKNITGEAPMVRDYDPLTKILHWLVFMLVAAQYAVGELMPHIGRNAQDVGLIAWHISLGATVMLAIVVDMDGKAKDIRVVRSLGMGLDEKAIEAVRQYKFKPAMYQGHPVSVQIVIEMNFHLH